METQALPPLPQPLSWTTFQNESVKRFLQVAASVCKPRDIQIFDGTPEEYHRVCDLAESMGQFSSVNPYLYPRSYLIRSSVNDVARSEARTFVCGPMNETLYRVPSDQIPSELGFAHGARAGVYHPGTKKELNTEEMRELLYSEFDGCMKGRTMWIVPFSMAPINSDFSKFGIEITDSLYVVASMYIMCRCGTEVLKRLNSRAAEFLPCWHSVGVPLGPAEKDVPWPSRKDNNRKYIAHFTTPDPNYPEFGPYSVMSIGSGYGGNALLGKKCFALRIGSRMGAFEPVKWMAEHMLIIHVRHTPANAAPRDYYVTGAFPSACGKTNLAMIQPPPEFAKEWKVTCIGDDIAWIRMDSQGRLCAVNPEGGFFGVAPGTNDKTCRVAMDGLRLGNVLFTNVGITRDGDVWWDGMTPNMPKNLIDWHGRAVPEDITDPAQLKKQKSEVAGKNSRYTLPGIQCPSVDDAFTSGEGVPIDAMLFGGRRCGLTPLAVRTCDWADGVLTAACLRSEQTAAADRPVGALNFDPMAMRPFIGYNMGQYFAHWLEMGHLAKNHPDIYCVNWFRRSGGVITGDFLWEGFSQNFRVIKWVCEMAQAKREGRPVPQPNTPLGVVPTPADLGVVPGPNSPLKSTEPLTVNASDPAWASELSDCRQFLDILKQDNPPELQAAFNRRVERFSKTLNVAQLKYPVPK